VDTGALLSVPVGHPHRLHCWRGLGVPGRPPGQDEGTASSNPSQVQGKLDSPSQVQGKLDSTSQVQGRLDISSQVKGKLDSTGQLLLSKLDSTS
jgi:hypothetical protein